MASAAPFRSHKNKIATLYLVRTQVQEVSNKHLLTPCHQSLLHDRYEQARKVEDCAKKAKDLRVAAKTTKCSYKKLKQVGGVSTSVGHLLLLNQAVPMTMYWMASVRLPCAGVRAHLWWSSHREK